MAELGSTRGTVLGLSVALGVALLLIAFLLGRESAGSSAGVATVAELAAVERGAEEESGRRWPKWADLEDLDEKEPQVRDSAGAVVQRVERQAPDTFAVTKSGTRAQSPRSAATQTGSPPAQGGGAVAAYFQQIDVIHSGEGAGDPNSFAMSLIKSGLGGSTSGFDQLIADTEHMEKEMQAVRPPPSCERYHEASIDALVDSRQMLERMKNAITGRDIAALNAIALESKELQRKADAIKEMREQIVATGGGY